MEAPLTFRKNGFDYTLISLGQRSCIYEQTYTQIPPVSYFEVFRIKEQKEFKFNGKTFPAKFRVPGNEDFGNWAWVYRDKDKAIKHFNELEKSS
jgi:hypothetical protein